MDSIFGILISGRYAENLRITESIKRTDKMGKYERNFPICHVYFSLPSMRNMYET